MVADVGPRLHAIAIPVRIAGRRSSGHLAQTAHSLSSEWARYGKRQGYVFQALSRIRLGAAPKFGRVDLFRFGFVYSHDRFAPSVCVMLDVDLDLHLRILRPLLLPNCLLLFWRKLATLVHS